MIDLRNHIYDTEQQSLYACILDAVNTDIDVVTKLVTEGRRLLEAVSGEINNNEAVAVVRHLNIQLLQHAIRISTMVPR